MWTIEQRREYQREYQKRKREDPEYREKHNAQQREYYQRTVDQQREYSRRYRESHIEKRKAYSREYGKRNRELKRLKRFGMTVEQYDKMLEAQGGGCAMCGIKPVDGARSLDIDHDHRCCPGRESCGKCVRGLLCTRHNMGLGQFGDDVEQLKAAIEYLTLWAGQ